MFALLKSNRKTSARNQIDIECVKDGIVTLSRRRYRVVLATSSVNFELKSESEQDVIIETFESFLNSIGWPLQILIRVREVDADKYISDLAEQYAEESEDVYRLQFTNYQAFILSLVKLNKILTRHFYVVVPYEAGNNADFDSVREQLGLRIEIAKKGLARIGLATRVLSSLEALDLFYSFYNHEQSKIQPLTERTFELLHSQLIRAGGIND